MHQRLRFLSALNQFVKPSISKPVPSQDLRKICRLQGAFSLVAIVRRPPSRSHLSLIRKGPGRKAKGN